MRNLSTMWRVKFVWLIACLLPVDAAVPDHPHPRLWMSESEQRVVRSRLASDQLAAAIHAALLEKADQIVESRTSRHEIPDGVRLLRESRFAVTNVGHCAWAWRFTGKEVYRERVIEEMEAVCAMSDWNPSHFLDTAEMALAVGWGYDWLYDTLSVDQRSRFSRELIRKGLLPAKNRFESKAWWTSPKNNWAQVCGAGIAIAAAAVYEEDPVLASGLISSGLDLVQRCHEFYMPDGMYPEGPGYWQYGTMYHVKLLAACESLGIPFAGDAILRKAGSSIIHLEGPSGYSFNFADSGAKKGVPSAAQCWIARQYEDQAQVAYVRAEFAEGIATNGKRLRSYGGPLSLLWLPEAGVRKSLPLQAFFGGKQPVAVFRSSWDHHAPWLAMKGGAASVSHGQMDVGSFVYDVHGLRWFHDLGSDSYGLEGYFGGRRWDYFRLQNRSHNTLEINGLLQNPQANPSPLVSSGFEGQSGFAEFDLSPAYQGAAKKVVRRVVFDRENGSVRLTDQISKPAGEIVWRAFTDANVEILGNRVRLSKDGKSIILEHGLSEVVWKTGDASPSTSEENPNAEFTEISLTVPVRDFVEVPVRILP